jgi:lipopolysaccharide biosynthesis glycosyltransferase
MIIHVALAFDKNYLRQFYAMAASLFAHHKSGELALHVIASGIEEDEINSIYHYVEANGHIISFYTVEESTIKKFVLVNQWTHAVYLRLFFPLIVPAGIARILYLDVDIIVTQSLQELWQTNLDSHPVAAVYDNYVKTQPLIGIHQEGEYFNSGMLLINRGLWNELKISEKAMNFLSDNPEKILFVDQCGLNAVLKGQWLKLPARFNFMYSSVPPTASRDELKVMIREIVVVHYTLQRPWHMLCRNRLAYLYFYYLEQSPARKSGARFTDISLAKIPAYLKIKLLNLYFDLTFVRKLWQVFKSN